MTDSNLSLGAFQLTRLLGQGGMAEVWAGTHRVFGGEAAVKVMLAGTSMSAQLRAAFFDEARSHAALEHQNIVRLLDFGHVGPADRPPSGASSDDPYLVMELADGTLRGDYPTSWGAASAALHAILNGLAYSHARGVIHRDLKPENVLRVGDVYKLSDFGIAHSLRLDDTADRTTLSMTIGTPHYMSPEQFRGRWYDFGPPTDLYALGCLAFELVCGVVPYPQTRIITLGTAHMSAPIPVLEPRFPVPEGLGAWVARLLQKDPGDRFAFAADAAHALRELERDFDGSAIRSEPADSSDFLPPHAPTVLEDMRTVLDTLAGMMAGETLDASDLAFPAAAEEGEPAGVVPYPVEPAPLPPSWGVAKAPGNLGQGLGLFAIRQSGFVGRANLRDQLWGAVRDVAATRRPHVVLLRGSEDAPVSELGDWLSLQAAEVGAAHGFQAYFTRAGGPREGLPGLMEDAFGAWGMRESEVRTRVEDVVRRRVDPDLAGSCTEVLITEILRARGEDTHQRRVPSRAERDRAIAALLEQSTDRPTLLWVRDAQWGADALALAQRLIGRQHPWLVVLGVRGHVRDPHTQHLLAEVEASEHSTVVDVENYSATEQALLADDMLPMTAETRAAVISPTHGDGVALRLLLATLIEREQLQPSGEGFVLAADVSLPPTRGAIFSERISSFIARNPRRRAALEVAAILGRAPDDAELGAACERLGVDTRDLGVALVDAGLARASSRGWWFIHDAVVDVITQNARALGTWATHNLACAEALLERGGGEMPVLLARAAEHLVAAEQAERALGPLFDAAMALVSWDQPRARSLEARHAELLADLHLADDHPAHVDAANLRVGVMLADGRTEEAATLAEQTAARGARIGYVRGQGQAWRHLARLRVSQGRLAEAAQLFEDAAQLATGPDHVAEQAASFLGLGTARQAADQADLAVDAFARAAAGYQALGNTPRAALAIGYGAAALAAAGRLDEARERANQALLLGLESGGLVAANVVMAEVCRLSGDFAQARERYTEARGTYLLASPANATVMDLNLALVDVAERDHEAATRRLADVIPAFRAMGWEMLLAQAHAAEAVVAALCEDEGGVQAALEQMLDVVGPDGIDGEVRWVLEQGRLDTPAAAAIVELLELRQSPNITGKA